MTPEINPKTLIDLGTIREAIENQHCDGVICSKCAFGVNGEGGVEACRAVRISLIVKECIVKMGGEPAPQPQPETRESIERREALNIIHEQQKQLREICLNTKCMGILALTCATCPIFIAQEAAKEKERSLY